MPPRPALLTVSLLLTVLTILLLALFGLLLIFGISVVREGQAIDVERILDPTHGPPIWAREPVRALWENGVALGIGIVVYAVSMLMLVFQAWMMRRWALALLFPFSAGLLVTGLGAPVAILLLVATGRAYAQVLAYSRNYAPLFLQHRPPVPPPRPGPRPPGPRPPGPRPPGPGRHADAEPPEGEASVQPGEGEISPERQA